MECSSRNTKHGDAPGMLYQGGKPGYIYLRGAKRVMLPPFHMNHIYKRQRKKKREYL